MTKTHAETLKRKRKEEDPWVKKTAYFKQKTYTVENKTLWSADVTRRLYEAFSKRCALTNDEIDESQMTFTKKDPAGDFIPLNCVLVRKWNIKQTRSASFKWTDDQLERIRVAHEAFTIAT